MLTLIKRSGWPFSYDITNYHGIQPSQFEWTQDDNKFSGVTVYFDHNHLGGVKDNRTGLGFLLDYFDNSKDRLSFLKQGFKSNNEKLKFLLNGFRKSNKDRLSFLWLSESRAIEGKVHKHVLKNRDLFFDCYDAIFVHDREMIEKDNRFRYLPNGSNKHWVTDCGIHKKNKLISMINSGKRMCEGHLLRNKITARLKDKIDLFGLMYNPIERKEEGLNEYMFSIALENARYRTYITEKILDCFATGTIPIYWGAPDIGDYFNEDGIIKWTDDFDIGQLRHNDEFRVRLENTSLEHPTRSCPRGYFSGHALVDLLLPLLSHELENVIQSLARHNFQVLGLG